MKIVQINTVPNGSTGTIMMNIHKALLAKGYESYVVWGRGRIAQNENEIYMNDKLGVYYHAFYSRITGKVGFASKKSTKKLIEKLKKINPDIIHLHNIHGYYINIELLFNYIKQNNIKVIWTLHDCWSFTGHCCHFEEIRCKKWQMCCQNCPQLKKYPKSLLDSSKWCYNKKRNLFQGISDLTIVTPSVWLSELVKKSFLGNYKVIVINNGIDTSIFKIIDKKNLKFRKKYSLENKKIILGVASPWTEKKGLKDFIELSKMIDNKYKIVLVGLTPKQINNIPKDILGLERTNSVNELVDIYNSSDIFLNLTYEDNYPTVNLEAVACGLPVITYNSGGSCESAFADNKNNFCIEKGISNISFEILNIDKSKIKKVPNEKISVENMIKKYISLYEKDK